MRSRGFTLLEMMIAMAILSGALTWVVLGMSRNIRAENRAKLTATATFLARQRITEFEDELYEKGFSEFDNEVSGTFEEKGFSRFTWRVIVDKVELPSTEQIQTMLTKAQEAKSALTGEKKDEKPVSGSTTSPTSPLGMATKSGGAGALASQFQIIKEVLEQGIRRVTVKVEWKEGKQVHSVDVVVYYTDVRKVDQAIMLGGAMPGAGGAPGAPATGTPAAPGAPK